MPTKKPARPKGGKSATKKPVHTAGKAKPAKKAVKKTIAKKPAKPVFKKGAAKKPAKKIAVNKPVAKAVVKKVAPVSKPIVKEHAAPKKNEVTAKSFVSVKQTTKPIVKKEPPRSSKKDF